MTIASEITRINNNIASAYTAINTKGGTLPATQNSANLATAIASIPSGGAPAEVEEKDVNFYDYDGTRLYSYTTQEFANLSALPSNPSHTGLTAQGWNWTLADAKTFVAKYGFHNIGQMYTTSDGKTRVYVNLNEDTLQPYVGFALESGATATIDWGDGTAQSTVTGAGTDYTQAVRTQHTYSSAGRYVISISSSSKIYISGNSTASYLLTKNTNNNSNENRAYNACIEKLELGNVDFTTYALCCCQQLKTITMPNTITGILAQMFQYNQAIKCVVFPKSCTQYTTNAFSYCGAEVICINKETTALGYQGHRYAYSLKSLAVTEGTASVPSNYLQYCYGIRRFNIPEGTTTLTTSCYAYCVSMTHITIPASVTSIQASAFSYWYGAKYFDFTKHTAVPTLANANAFSNTPTDCKIVVPDDLYSTWVGASNWSTRASQIIKESDWNA